MRKKTRTCTLAVIIILLAAGAAAQPAAADGGLERPAGLTAQAVSEGVNLMWEDPQDPDVTHYEIYRRTLGLHPPGTFELIEPDTGSGKNSYTDRSARTNKTYIYRVRAIGNEHKSPRSSYARINTNPRLAGGAPGRTTILTRTPEGWQEVSRRARARLDQAGNWPRMVQICLAIIPGQTIGNKGLVPDWMRKFLQPTMPLWAPGPGNPGAPPEKAERTGRIATQRCGPTEGCPKGR